LLKQLLKQQCFEEKATLNLVEIIKFVSYKFYLLPWFLQNDTKYIKASESFHPPLNVYRREREEEGESERRENENRKARRSW